MNFVLSRGTVVNIGRNPPHIPYTLQYISQKCPFSWGDLGPRKGFRTDVGLSPKRHLGRFIRFTQFARVSNTPTHTSRYARHVQQRAASKHCARAARSGKYKLHMNNNHKTHTHTHTRLTALCPWPPGWACTRKVKPIWILLKQETVSGSGVSWAICKSAPRSRQITMPVPHHSVFYRSDALPAAQPTASKHWRQE